MKLGPLQTQWLADLRSGKYKQTTTYLHDANGFCCLGIATEITCGLAPVKVTKMDHVREYPDLVSSLDDITRILLPEQIVKKMKFRTRAGDSRDSLSISALSELNDDGVSFSEIADLVEATPYEYFTGPA